MVNQITAECNSKLIEIEQRKKAALVSADAILESTKAKCEAMIKEAEAENEISQSVQKRREYELKMAKTEVLESKC